MKKFFALVLALAMVMSMAAVSMAADVVGPYDYDADKNLMRLTGLQYGDTAYFLLAEDGAVIEIYERDIAAYEAMGYEVLSVENGIAKVTAPSVPMTDYKQVEKLKVKVDFEMGEELVKSVSVEKKLVDTTVLNTKGENQHAADLIVKDGYYYFIAVKLDKPVTTADSDIIGTFELNRKADVKEGVTKIDDAEFDFAINVFYNQNYIDGAEAYVIDDKNDVAFLDWDTDYALKFDYDEEVEFNFGGDNAGQNEGTYTVDVSGQGKVYLRWNTKADEAIVAANPGVKMHFVNFNGVKFNRVGEFAYEMEDGVACYKVVDGALVAIPGAEYDESDETFYFNTRTLENYVFASAELVNPVVEAPVVEAPVATNPSTGA